MTPRARSRRLLLRRAGRLLREIWRFARGRLLAVMALSTLAALAEGVGILLLAPLLNRLGVNGAAAPFPWLELALAGYAALAAVAALVVAARRVAARRLSLEFVDHVRRRLQGAVMGLEWRAFSRLRASDLSHALVHDVDQTSVGVDFLLGLGGHLAQAAIAAGVVAALSPALLTGTILAGLALLPLGRRLNQRLYTLGQQVGLSWQRVMAEIGNDLAGFRLVKAFGLAPQRRQRYGAVLADLRDRDLALHRAMARTIVTTRTLGAIVAVLVLIVAIRGLRMTPSQTVAAVVAVGRLVQVAMRVQDGWRMVVHALPAHARIASLLARCRRAAEPEPPSPAPMSTDADIGAGERLPEIRLRDVRVQPADDRPPALDGVTLTLPPGALVVVMGPSGAGKSTLGDVLLGLIAPDGGQVLIDGRPLATGDRPGWRRRTSLMPQDALLFDGSIADNLRLGRAGASDDDLWRALGAAGAGDFVRALPHGLATGVGDRGIALSGGERQRLALARALLRRPALLVLDEPTSALDAQAEARILDALDGLRGQMTIVLITHRPGLARRADQVIRLEAGRLCPRE